MVNEQMLTREDIMDVTGGQEVLCMHRDNAVVRTGNIYGGVLYMDSGAFVCDVEFMCTKCGAVWTRKEKVN